MTWSSTTRMTSHTESRYRFTDRVKCATLCPRSKLVINRRCSITPCYLPSFVYVCVHVGTYFLDIAIISQIHSFHSFTRLNIFLVFPAFLELGCNHSISCTTVMNVWKRSGLWSLIIFHAMQGFDNTFKKLGKKPLSCTITQMPWKGRVWISLWKQKCWLVLILLQKKPDNHPRWWCLCSCVHTLHCT